MEKTFTPLSNPLIGGQQHVAPSTFPEGIKFKYPWRKYQQRVLNELEEHLSDRHLHVIAPPGSGKTVLGLEVALRINKPTLVLAPTVAIRNQWIQRFCELFLRTHTTPYWISRDIRNPRFLTVVTYQGLHAACNDLRVVEDELEDEEETNDDNGKVKAENLYLSAIVQGLQEQQIGTIVVDEAHHLKNAWWQTLTKVKEQLDPIVVGLTATPPYDVTANEWQRYLDLNGPVDTEISVPELVVEGDLCPHQDYVYFTYPTEIEQDGIIQYRQNINKLFQEINHDEILLKAMVEHPVWVEPTKHLDWIYSNLACYSACLIFLHANGVEIPETHREVIGEKDLTIPVLDYAWMETLLDFFLYRDKEHFKKFEEHQRHIENKLRRYGAIERRQINFIHNRKVTGFLTSSISKLQGIKDIVDFEFSQLEHELRLVILSDYIRKEYFVSTPENSMELNKIGVMSIFEKLRRENTTSMKIGVLTGSMIIIPKSAFGAFEAKALKYGITTINSSTLPYDDNYVLINQTEQLKHDVVHIVTQIFQLGEIEVLVGTKSLLGEGWDAPAINALVLASFVGSFVLSNQMRGRAIRTQKDNVGKTSNIWHLVCIDHSSPTGGDDFDLLRRRFRSFVGVSTKGEPAIENGTGRLDIPKDIFYREAVERKNQETLQLAGDRESLRKNWDDALKGGVNLVEEIKIPFVEEKPYRATMSMYWNKTIANLIVMLTSAMFVFFMQFFNSLGQAGKVIRSLDDFLVFFTIFMGAGALAFGGMAYRTFGLYVQYRDITKDIQQIGNALLSALIREGSIHTAASKLRVDTSVNELGDIYCHLEGGTTFEKSIFINALQEVIGKVDNPRYVILRRSKLFRYIHQKDFHSVPELLGRNKRLAEYFKDQWESMVGECELVFTRTLEGRKLLLKSRIKSLSAQFDEEIEHVNKWR
jgi:superfamily II DNA or RNA helicase